MRVMWRSAMCGDVAGPVFPVPTVADLVDDLGVDGVAPFVEVEVSGKLGVQTRGVLLVGASPLRRLVRPVADTDADRR